MARSSWTQSSFLAGQWDVAAQGRIDDPKYREALAVCSNCIPQEQGSVVLRSGSRMCGPTHGGYQGVTISWDVANYTIYDLELTVNTVAPAAFLRIWAGDQIMLNGTQTITAISTGNPCEITLSGAVTWNTGDTIRIVPVGGLPAGSGTSWAPLVNRDIAVTMIDSEHFTLTDAVTGQNIQVGSLTIPAGTYAGRIYVAALPYTTFAQLQTLVAIPENLSGTPQLILCSPGIATYVVTMGTLPTPTTWPTVSVGAFEFCGPFQKPLNLVNTGTVSAYTGSVTFTITGGTANGSLGLQSTDVGRYLYLYSQPPAYNNSTAYVNGNVVFWNNVAYQASQSATGKQPDQNPSYWTVAPEFLYWAPAKITAVSSGTVCTVNLNNLAGSFAIPSLNGDVITIWALGVYNSTLGVYPGCGCFHEGRLWLFGAVPGELDASESAPDGFDQGVGGLTFRPTDQYGNVNDSNAIQYTMGSASNNQPIWALPDLGGIIVGMYGEEWLISASANNNILTPTSIQAHRQSRYGSYNHQPVYAGMAIAFIQRFAGTIFEYIADVFSGRFTGLPLNAKAKKVTQYLQQVAYVETAIPIVWARNNQNNLVGCTYRRTSRFVNAPPEFSGWHQHSLAGVAPYVCSLQASVAPSPNGSILNDTVAFVSNTQANLAGTSYRQILMPPYDPDLGDEFFWGLDGAFTGNFGNNAAYQPNVSVGLLALEDGVNMYFNGVWYQPGSVTVYLAGIDFGSFPIVNGSVTVPYGSDPNKLGTRAYIASQALASNTNGAIAIGTLGYVPGLIGTEYSGQIKLLRNDLQQAARTENGAASGETRRPYECSALLGVAYQGNTVQVDNQPAYPLVVRQYISGPATAANVPFSGVWQDTIAADASYDGQVTFNLIGPYPFMLCSATPFTETEER